MSAEDMAAIKAAAAAVRSVGNPGKMMMVGTPVSADVVLSLVEPEDRLRVAELLDRPIGSWRKLRNGITIVRTT